MFFNFCFFEFKTGFVSPKHLLQYAEADDAHRRRFEPPRVRFNQREGRRAPASLAS